MNIYFSGNTKAVSRQFFEKIEAEHKCIIHDEKEEIGKDTKKIYSAYDFNTAVFFSHNINAERKIYDEMESLEQLLYDCKANKIQNFIYITGNDLERLVKEELAENTRDVFEQSCIQACKLYAEKNGMIVTVIKIPFLYNMEGNGKGISKWIKDGMVNASSFVHGMLQSEIDFLCDEDLGDLVLRILSEHSGLAYTEMNVSGENQITFGQLEASLREFFPTYKMEYTGERQGYPCYAKTPEAREDYGWYPKHILAEDIKSIYERLKGNKTYSDKAARRKQRFNSVYSGLIAVVELVVGIILAEGINYLIKDNIMLRFIDCRLVYVAVIGILHGLNAGIMAVILSCVGYVLSITGQTHWQVVFYNVENWLPFACYLLMGAISGYTKDKYESEIKFTQEENEILEQKYEFLSELYSQVMESKNQYNSQIIGFQDSFGKIYSIVKKLDVVKSSEVFYEAVNVMEELMENDTVAIYSINLQSDFARLNVCSKSLNDFLMKSRRLSSIPEVIESLKAKELFVNKECKADYPEYATPIFKGTELVGMIVLEEVGIKQMNMEYRNKFMIITDLIKDSLIRAAERENDLDMYVPGTEILTATYFQEEVDIKQKMKEKQYSDYTILRQELPVGSNLVEVSQRMEKLIRSNDVMGLDENGNLLLMLTQTHNMDLTIVNDRMQKNGFSFEAVDN